MRPEGASFMSEAYERCRGEKGRFCDGRGGSGSSARRLAGPRRDEASPRRLLAGDRSCGARAGGPAGGRVCQLPFGRGVCFGSGVAAGASVAAGGVGCALLLPPVVDPPPAPPAAPPPVGPPPRLPLPPPPPGGAPWGPPFAGPAPAPRL